MSRLINRASYEKKVANIWDTKDIAAEFKAWVAPQNSVGNN
jgi:hypothetical protein